MLHQKHGDTTKSDDNTYLNKKDLESAKASDEAASEVTSYRDPQCAELGRHAANCGCKGDARAPIVAAS